MSARASYQHASHGNGARMAPAEVHVAHEKLAEAERSFADDGNSGKTRDLAYIADRNARLADAVATTRTDQANHLKADAQFLSMQTKLAASATRALEKSETQLGQTKGELSTTKDKLADSEQQKNDANAAADSERVARVAAEKKSAESEQKLKDIELKLSALAAVKDEARGLVITLSGSVLFASGKAVLLPEAQTRLSQVADALLATREHHIVVEGHTDSRGTMALNIDLSQRRAEAVRAYLISRGYDADLITSMGIGPDRPIANNSSAEGRANNRRVEIVIQK